MKSKISFAKWVWEVWKRQIWVFALSCLGLFLSGPVFLISQSSGWRSDGNELLLQKNLFASFFTGSQWDRSGMSLFLFLTLVVGVISAWNGLGWLHMRSKVDFWHSLPITRTKIFAGHILSLILDLVISAGGMLLVMMGLGLSHGWMTTQAAQGMAVNAVAALLYGALGWAVASLAMLLTGRFLVGMLGTGVLLIAEPVAEMLFRGYGSAFFYTYLEGNSRSMLMELTGHFSPMAWALKTPNVIYTGEAWRYLGMGAVCAVLFLILDLWVYQKRPSEGAGRAMAFFLPGEIIKSALTILGALFSGLFFLAIMNSHRDGWLLFGLIFGVLLFYGVIQMIYDLDIRRLFAGRAALLVSLAGTLLLAAIFRFDLSGYDTWIPRQEDIASFGFKVNEGYNSYRSSLSLNTRRDSMEIPCDETTYGMLTALRDGAQLLYRADGEQAVENPIHHYTEVCIRLKNGKTYYREYTTIDPAIQEMMGQLYDYSEYKDGIYLARKIPPEKVGDICIENPRNDSDTMLFEGTDPKRLELVEALLADVEEMTPQTVLTEIPVANLILDMDLYDLQLLSSVYIPRYTMKSPGAVWEQAMYVYPSFRRTCALLEHLGCELGASPKEEEIGSLVFRKYEGGQVWQAVYETPEDIRRMLPYLIFSDLYNGWADVQNEMDVNYESADGSMTVWCTLLEDGLELLEASADDFHLLNENEDA